MTVTTSATQAQLSHSPEELGRLYAAQLDFFKSGATRSYAFRKGQLGVLRKAIERHEKEITEALRSDLRKNEFEAFGTELGPVYKEISLMEKNLRAWMEPRRQPTPLLFFPSTSYIQPEPRGVTLLIGPWNYPFILLMTALANSISAGNTAILKPSEEAPATEAVVRKIIGEVFEPEFVAVVTGPGHLVSEHLIEKHHLDMVFFTGSTVVGRKVMQSAAKQLTPVILELGGKSPCIVAPDAPIDYTARKVLFTSFLNKGQTCVAADYLLVHESVKDKMVAALKKYIVQFYGSDPKASPDYGRIINQRHFLRLQSYLSQGRILHGGEHDMDELYMAPTIMDNVSLDDPIMQEEIFGPILPVLTYRENEEALEIIERNPYPLALYVYTRSKATERFFLERIRFGGGCVNNGVIHLGNSHLPFNGVGYSGLSGYHGKYGFEAFSHMKSIMRSPTWADAPLWYAPYKNWYVSVLRRLMR
ncbi:MAG: aldehyde dehydrogenase [Chitinophagaceae bacterium]|jgi:aldehyde dehydrogenase (NAD+)|nr:aldehyde dehydrogenase [Chitinophagaceae bacterium]